MEDLTEIKVLRKKFNLTQHELAMRAQVSQSLIAKIEAGRIDPTFSNAQKIFSAIHLLQQKQEKTAGELMNRSIITIHPTDSISTTIKKMKKHQISQMPVVDGEKVVGLISETSIITKMGEADDPASVANFTARQVMSECPPTISSSAGFHVVSTLLRFYPAVIVLEEGKLCGLITKADVIEKIG